MSNKIKVLVVDDSSFMRSLLKRMIEKDERFEVIDIAKNGEEGVKLAKKLKPDVVTMDIEMPVMNGLEALKIIMQEDPCPVVMVSSLTEKGATATMQALELGAVDFIPKAMQDTEKNILQSGSILHEKLAAAASVGSHITKTIRAPERKPVTVPVVDKPREKIVSPNTILQKETIEPVKQASQPKKFFSKGSTKILVIGSSTGGPRALSYLISELPKLNIPIVVAQHMPAKFTLAMAERINKESVLIVKEAENNEVLNAGTVYIAPGGLHMRIKNNAGSFSVDLQEDKGESVYKPSVEVLGQSIFDAVGKNIVAVMLTGMGSDGAEAFTKIHNAGGYVIAQDKESCVVYGMSRSVVENGGADDILPIEGIKNKLIQLLG